MFNYHIIILSSKDIIKYTHISINYLKNLFFSKERNYLNIINYQ